MTKNALRIGYLLECRNGRLKMLMPTESGKTLVDSNGKFYNFDELNEDLTTKFDEDFDIMKVYGFSKLHSGALEFETRDRELLWQRNKKEMTIEEIEKALGYQIKIIKD